MRTLGKVVLVASLGFLLMFVGHVGAFLATVYAGNLHLPYWWAYLLLYPILAVMAVRRAALPPLVAAVAACLSPGAYFLALGVLEGEWTASSTAIFGVGLAFLLAIIAATWASRQHHTGAAA